MADTVSLRFFGPLRDAVGTKETTLCADTVREAVAEAERRYGASFAAIMATSRIWLNGEPVELDATLREGDALAFLPPSSGG